MSKDDMAAELARETCESYKELRDAARQAEEQAEPPHHWNDAAAECMQTLEALLKGRHRRVVLPIILEFFPELMTPATATEQELAAAMRATAGKQAN